MPPRVEYALTDKGEALRPIIEDMRAWGSRWLEGDAACVADEPETSSSPVAA